MWVGSLPDVATRLAPRMDWHRHFGPLSGSEPKLADPLVRYAVITFTCGSNLGRYQMSRHLRGAVRAHEFSAPGNQRVTLANLNVARADTIDAFMALDVAGSWGDGSKVGAHYSRDDSLLAQTSTRVGGRSPGTSGGGTWLPPKVQRSTNPPRCGSDYGLW